MASKLELLAEAHRRGILPPDKVPLFEEAQRRGLIGGGPKQQGGRRSDWSPEMQKGYAEYQQFQKDNNLPNEGSALLAANSASFGFGDELSAGIKAGAGALYDLASGKTPELSRRYDEAWGAEQARLDNARKNAVGGGLPAEILGGFALGPGKAVTSAATAGTPMTLRQAASQSAKQGAAYGGAYGVGSDDSGTLAGRAETGAYGAGGGYLLGRAIPNVIAGGSYIKQNAIDRPVQAFRQRLSSQANKAAQDFQQAGVNADEVFPPALVQGGPVEGVSTHLAGTVFGGRLRQGAQDTRFALEKRLAEEVAAAGGRRSPAEAGEDVQNLLRTNLLDRSIPSDQVKRMSPAELQDVSGVAPGPKYDPPPPIVDPVPPRPVREQTADDVLRAAEMEIQEPLPLLPPAREPKYPKEATPNYRRPSFDDVPEPPELSRERSNLTSMYDEARTQHGQVLKGVGQLQDEVKAVRSTAGVEDSRIVGNQLRVTIGGNEYAWNGSALVPPRLPARPDLAVNKTPAEQPRGLFGMLSKRQQQQQTPQPIEKRLPQLNVSNEQAMALQRLSGIQKMLSERSNMLDSLSRQARNVRAAIDDIDNQIERARSEGLAQRARDLRAAEDARVAEANASLPQKRAEAERIARELTEQDRRLAQEASQRELDQLREAARKAAEPNAEQLAASRTAQLRREAEAEARRATIEKQKAVDADHAADLARRREQANQEFELGKGNESFVTQLDAAYEQVARNAPAIQKNPLGAKNEPGRTRTAQLLDEFAQDARKSMKLRGYKSGNPFDDDGAIRPDFLEYLDEHLGGEVASRLRAFSRARARGEFVPSVQGLRDMRTAIGREIEAAKKARYQGETRTADEAMLARLYDSLSQDVMTFLRGAGEEGLLAARQMSQVDSEYKRFLRDLRMPLSKLFGEKTPPEQAIATLRKATRAKDGDINLLNRFYTVASARGDRLRATNSILQSMLDDGLPTFLKEYRNISPEAKKIMFSGAAKGYGESLDAIARAGGHLERFMERAGRTPRLRETVANPGNIMAVLSGFLHVPTAMLGIAGATATSKVLASKGFNQWLRAAPKELQSQRNWRKHVYRLRGLMLSHGRVSDQTGQQLLSALLPMETAAEIEMPRVVPRYKTRQDVIERLQYEAQ